MIETLKTHIEKTVPLNPTESDYILSKFMLRHYKKHQYIIQEGNMAKHQYFLISGLTKLVYNDQEGKEHILSFAMEDWWESDFESFFTNSPAKLSLICLEDTSVYQLSYSDYNELCLKNSAMQRFFLEKANQGYLALQRRILASLSTNTKERYEQFIKLYPSLSQRLPKSQLAAYLGVSRETLSRLKD